MPGDLFHVFRNTPYGRETLLQSAYFCRMADLTLRVYIPHSKKFLMYFESNAVQIDLDQSYLRSPETAEKRTRQIVESFGFEPRFIEPKDFTASTLPDIPTHFDFMTCPRSMTDVTSRIGLNHIGPKVRHVVQSAPFPVVIPSPIYKPWRSLAVFFGGSVNALKALRLGLDLGETAGVPVDLFTQVEGPSFEPYRQAIEEAFLEQRVERRVRHWYRFTKGKLEDNLYQVPHDALVILGAYGHGLMKQLLFGSKMEIVQATLPNSLLVVGPQYTEMSRRLSL